MSESPESSELATTRAALSENESGFRLMADSAPVLIWLSGVDKACIWFNQAWLDFRGRTIEQERGQGWVEGVHPDDVRHCTATYLAAFDRRESFERVFRLQDADGDYRWVLDRGRARHTGDGSFVGYVGSCTDVTNMKQVEVHLERDRQVLRELVEVGDRERQLVAHDIHDGLLQHVFAADMFVQSAMALLTKVRVETTAAKLREAQKLLGKAIQEGRRMINSLRPLILEEEGIVPALRHRVAELNEQQTMRIDLVVNGTIGRLHGVWEGNLFRIVDEAITNMIRHSQSTIGEVRLTHADGWISVEVQDEGVGFDVSQVHAGCFGLRSIMERSRIFKGDCRIDSCPGTGTLISVALPVPLSDETA